MYIYTRILKTRKADGVNPSPIASISEAEKRSKFLLPQLFVLFQPSMDYMMPIHVGEGIYFTESIHSKANLIQEFPLHTQK